MSDWKLSGADIELLRLAYDGGRGDLGVRSTQNGITVAAEYEPIGRNVPKAIRTAAALRSDGTQQEAGGWTLDVGLRCGPVYVATPKPQGKPDFELDDGALRVLTDVSFGQRVVRALGLRSPGALRVLKAVYVDRREVHAALAIFDEKVRGDDERVERMKQKGHLVAEPDGPRDDQTARLSLLVEPRSGVSRITAVAAYHRAARTDEPLEHWLLSVARAAAEVPGPGRKPDAAAVQAVQAIKLEVEAVWAAACKEWHAAKAYARASEVARG